MRFKYSVVVVLLFVLSATANAQLVKFNVMLFGEKVGTLVITKKVNGTEEVYSLESRSKAHFLWIDKENYARYDVVYRDGKLFTAESKEIENGKSKRWTKVTQAGSGYQVDSYKGKRTINELAQFSVVRLFFEDGSTQKKLFFEGEAEICPIKSPEPGTCEFKGSDGSRNVYYYKNGKLAYAEFHVSIATVKLVPGN